MSLVKLVLLTLTFGLIFSDECSTNPTIICIDDVVAPGHYSDFILGIEGVYTNRNVTHVYVNKEYIKFNDLMLRISFLYPSGTPEQPITITPHPNTTFSNITIDFGNSAYFLFQSPYWSIDGGPNKKFTFLVTNEVQYECFDIDAIGITIRNVNIVAKVINNKGPLIIFNLENSQKYDNLIENVNVYGYGDAIDHQKIRFTRIYGKTLPDEHMNETIGLRIRNVHILDEDICWKGIRCYSHCGNMEISESDFSKCQSWDIEIDDGEEMYIFNNTFSRVWLFGWFFGQMEVLNNIILDKLLIQFASHAARFPQSSIVVRNNEIRGYVAYGKMGSSGDEILFLEGVGTTVLFDGNIFYGLQNYESLQLLLLNGYFTVYVWNNVFLNDGIVNTKSALYYNQIYRKDFAEGFANVYIQNNLFNVTKVISLRGKEGNVQLVDELIISANVFDPVVCTTLFIPQSAMTDVICCNVIGNGEKKICDFAYNVMGSDFIMYNDRNINVSIHHNNFVNEYEYLQDTSDIPISLFIPSSDYYNYPNQAYEISPNNDIYRLDRQEGGKIYSSIGPFDVGCFNISNSDIHCEGNVVDVLCFGISQNELTVCSSHGECIGDNGCVCNIGFTGERCTGCNQTYHCNSIGTSCYFNVHYEPICSCPNSFSGALCEMCEINTFCNSPNHASSCDVNIHGRINCKCMNGFTGSNCTIPSPSMSCGGINYLNNSTCNGHGECVFPELCVCDWGYFTSDYFPDCSDYYCSDIWPHKNSSDTCFGHGECIGPNTCLCEVGYYSNSEDPYCSNFFCGNISKAEFPNICNNRGYCKAPEQCVCTDVDYYSSIKSPFCGDYNCDGISKNSNDVCYGHGDCSSPNVCSCASGYETTFENPYCGDFKCGDLYKDNGNVCNGHGMCLSNDNCLCDEGYESTITKPFCGAIIEVRNCSEISDFTCNGHGDCNDLTGRCLCHENYFSNNEYLHCSFFLCHGRKRNDTNSCDGHGICEGHNICKCDIGYNGNKCKKEGNFVEILTQSFVIGGSIFGGIFLFILFIVIIVIVILLIMYFGRTRCKVVPKVELETKETEGSVTPQSNHFVIMEDVELEKVENAGNVKTLGENGDKKIQKNHITCEDKNIVY